METISELAKIIRSKNAGPFMTTVDIFFDNIESYEKVKDSLTNEVISKLYRIPIDDIIGIFHLDIIMGIKVTFIKQGGIASGDQECTDIFGSNQHVPLTSFKV